MNFALCYASGGRTFSPAGSLRSPLVRRCSRPADFFAEGKRVETARFYIGVFSLLFVSCFVLVVTECECVKRVKRGREG